MSMSSKSIPTPAGLLYPRSRASAREGFNRDTQFLQVQVHVIQNMMILSSDLLSLVTKRKLKRIPLARFCLEGSESGGGGLPLECPKSKLLGHFHTEFQHASRRYPMQP